MCGRFKLGADATTLAAQFDLFGSPVWAPRYNIAPTQAVRVVVVDPATAKRHARRHRWRLIPPWAKNPAIGNQLINAQAETAATQPAFRAAFRTRRCLILADGFYGWKKEGRHKQPFHIRLRDRRPFVFAGLWEHWEGSEGQPIDSCTILTATPNDLLRPLHHRMAVILPASAYDLWLDATVQEGERLQPRLRLSFPKSNLTPGLMLLSVHSGDVSLQVRASRRRRRDRAAAPVDGQVHPWPRTDASASDGTTERPNTHNLGVLEVCYPWHPWYGQQVQVQAVRGQNGLRVMRCTPCERPRFPGLEIPRWMCDPETSGTGKLNCGRECLILVDSFQSSLTGRGEALSIGGPVEEGERAAHCHRHRHEQGP